MESTRRRFLMAGGGSGGHISPALAVAERLVERDGGVFVRFVCSHRAVDARMLDGAAAPYVPLSAAPLSLRPRGAMNFLASFRRGRRQAAALLEEHAITDVVAFGGFVAGPVVAAAAAASVRVTLLNLDDPPGRANRWMARHAHEVWSAIELPRHPDFATRIVGVPVRRAALARSGPAECRAALGLDPRRRTLLVTGASQGAGSLNAFLPALAEARGDAFASWQVLHLAGAGAERDIRGRYERAGVPALVVPFLDEMGLAWGAADLAVSRAGANSVAEVAANAVPTLFLPYPYHRDQHQRRNALPLADGGAAVIVDDEVEADANVAHAGEVLLELMTDEARRESMRRRLASARGPDAAGLIADLLLEGAQDEPPVPAPLTAGDRIGS